MLELFPCIFMSVPGQTNRQRHNVCSCMLTSVYSAFFVNAIFWKRINRFLCQSAQVIEGRKAWKDRLCGSADQRSRSHESSDPQGGGMKRSALWISRSKVKVTLVKWSAGWWHETIGFVDQQIKGQGHTSQVICRVVAWNDRLCGSADQRSMSHESEDRLGSIILHHFASK